MNALPILDYKNKIRKIIIQKRKTAYDDEQKL